MVVVVVVVAGIVCQTPYYAMQWVAVAMQRDVATHHQQGARVRPPAVSRLYVLVVANMFSQILVFVSSCCNPIIYALAQQRTLRLSIDDRNFDQQKKKLSASSTDCSTRISVRRGCPFYYCLTCMHSADLEWL